MNSYISEDVQGDFQTIETNEGSGTTIGIEMISTDAEKADPEFHLANDTIEASPRSATSGVSSIEIYGSSLGREQNARQRPKSARVSALKTTNRPIPPSSSIPLPVKSSGPIKIPSMLKNTRTASRVSTLATRTMTVGSKHTLEIQFINKNKRFIQMKKELVEKQRPILDLYQNLTQIKKRLEELGKTVKLEEVKLIPVEEYNRKPNVGDGEHVSMEVVNSMKTSIEEIPTTLMDICKNLLSRRALIVELLESVTKSEVDVDQVSDKIESLKCEGQQLQHSLDAVIEEHESKICQLVCNWQKLLTDKQCFNTDSKIEDLENKLSEEEKLREASSNMINELQRKMEDRRIAYDRSMAELNGVLQTLREQIRKLEQDLDNERKSTVDFKSRNNTNAQNLKVMRGRITELESEKKDVETSNSELQKKMRLMQEQLKYKEAQWVKEKDELNKSLKHQEHLLQKLTADKNQFETRLETIENSKDTSEEQLNATISSLKGELSTTRNELEKVVIERNEAVEKCTGIESYLTRMGAESKETMNKVSYSIEWGKATREVSSPEADNYFQSVTKDLQIRELVDRVQELEKERQAYVGKVDLPNKFPKSQKESVRTYQMLLEESENKLKDKTTEVENLRAQVRQLKVRQESLEEKNVGCSTEDLQRMLDEGRQKLTLLMKRSVHNDSKLEKYMQLSEKQQNQMNEMDNLLRYKENMCNVLKTSRNDLLVEKESLARYSREVRTALAEVTSQCSKKDTAIKDLREKVTLQEHQVANLQEKIKELELSLQIANEKRYKLQYTFGKLEKEHQRAQMKIIESSEVMNKQYKPWNFFDTVCEVEDMPNKKVSHYCNSFMAKRDQHQFNLDQYDNTIEGPPLNYSASSRKKLHDIQNSQKSFRRDIDSPSSLNSSEYSSNKLSYQNLSFIENMGSIHRHCHHKANSRSLISLSLQKVDFIRTKLNFLTSVDTTVPENVLFLKNSVDENRETFQTQINSTQTTHSDHSLNQNLGKIVQLTAKRYEYLQNQANESYDDLTTLVKLAVSQEDRIKK